MRSRNWSRFSDFIAVRPDKKANKKVGFRPLIGKRTLHLSIHLSSGFEKLDEQRSALGPENALLDGNRVVEKARVSDLELTAHAAEAEVAGTEDEAADAGVDEGAGAHGAGLEGAIKGGAFKAVVAEAAGGLAEGENFGVSGGVGQSNGGVGGGGEQGAIGADEDSADGDLAGLLTAAGGIEGLTHPLFVLGVQSRSPSRGCLSRKASP